MTVLAKANLQHLQLVSVAVVTTGASEEATTAYNVPETSEFPQRFPEQLSESTVQLVELIQTTATNFQKHRGRDTETQGHRNTGTQGQRDTGTRKCPCPGTKGQWDVPYRFVPGRPVSWKRCSRFAVRNGKK